MKNIILIILAFCLQLTSLFAQTYVSFLNTEPQNLTGANPTTLYFSQDGFIYQYNPNSIENWYKSGPFDFISFFWKENNSIRTASDEYHKKYVKRVSRSINDRVKLYFPVPSDMLYPTVNLKWFQFKDTKEYHVFVTDRFNHVLMRKATTDTVLQVDFDQYNAQKGVCYFWYVEPDENKEERSDEICLNWVQDDIRHFVLEELDRVTRTPGQHPVQLHIMKAGLLEQHKMYMDALSEYKKALDLDPDADDIKRMYAMFLVRIGIIKNVKEIWN
jgi:hypothetical protein